MLMLMFYLKITMLMLLLLLVFVCLLHNEDPSSPPSVDPGFPLVFVYTMSVPHASRQTTENTVYRMFGR